MPTRPSSSSSLGPPTTPSLSHHHTPTQLADVVLEVDGVPIAGDETVPFRGDERLDYSHVVALKHVGETLSLKVLRTGQVRCWAVL